MSFHIENYQGKVNPVVLKPQLAQGYLSHPELKPIVELINLWQYKDAIDDLNLIIKESQGDTYYLALRLKGEILLQMYHFEEAFDCFEEIHEQLHGDLHSIVSMILIQAQLKQNYEAMLEELRGHHLMLANKVELLLKFIEINKSRFDLENLKSNQESIDTIALFGHRFEMDGSFSTTLLERLDKTYQLALEHPNAKIIVSGGAALSPFLEADKKEEWLISKGIDSNRILKDRKAKDTVGNVIGMVHLFKEIQAKKCIAVTSISHLNRAWLSLVAHAVSQNYSLTIHAAAPERPNSISQLPEDEEKYLLLTVFRSAQLVDYEHFLEI